MKRHPSPTRRSLIVLPFGRTRLEWFLLAFLLLAPQLVLGTDTHWTGNTDTTWGTSTNWDAGVPSGNTVNAVFNGTFTLGHQPTLTANPSTFGGIWMTTGVGQDVTIGGSTFTLTLNGNTINGTAGLGILIDNATTYKLTISCGLKLNAAQKWLNNSSNLFTVSGAVNTNTKALTIDGGGDTTVSGVVSSTGSITKTGNGTLTLSGANTYSGGTTLSSGALNVNNAGSGGTSSAIGTSTFTINGGTIDNTTSGAITLSTNNAITFGGNFTFGGTQNLTFGTGAITNAGNRTITLNGTNSTLTFGGIMTNTSNAVQTTTVNGAGNTLSLGGYALSSNATSRIDVIKGTGNVTITGAVTNGGTATASGLTYSGSGVLRLNGTSTYAGATTVNSGTLLVNGSTASGSTVSVNNSGTTLGGTGTINGAVTVGNGAILLGGTGSAASGTLHLANNLTLNSGSIIELALGGSGAHSTLARTGGTWTFNGTQAFTFIDLGAQATTYDNIITGLTGDPGTEGSWTITNAGWAGTFTYDGANIDLNITNAPEPATYLTGVLTLGALLLHQRRRWRCLLRRHVTSHL